MPTAFQEPTPWRLRWQEIKLPLDAFQFAEKHSRFSWFLARVSICIWDVASCAYPWFSDGSSLSSAFYYFVSVWDLWHQERMWHDKCKHLLTPKSIRSPFSPRTDYNLSRRSLVKSATRSCLSIAGVGMSTQLMRKSTWHDFKKKFQIPVNPWVLGSREGHELDGLCCSIHCALQPYRRFWRLEDNNNLTTFSQLAFAAGTLQAPLNDEAFEEFGNQLNAGHDLTIARLHFETQTWVVAHLKSQVSADATDTSWGSTC